MPTERRSQPRGPRYADGDAVDFVVVGSGAAGGVVARELSRAGLRVVVLEQGPYLTEADFTHDELAVTQGSALTNDMKVSPQTGRPSANVDAMRCACGRPWWTQPGQSIWKTCSTMTRPASASGPCSTTPTAQ